MERTGARLLTRVLVADIVAGSTRRRPQDYFINQGRKQARRGAELDPWNDDNAARNAMREGGKRRVEKGEQQRRKGRERDADA